MKLSDIEVGAVYTYDKHSNRKGWGRGCSTSGQPAVILEIKKIENLERDNCNRQILRKRTLVHARVYNISAGNKDALNFEELDKIKGISEDTFVEARHLIWPWEQEVAKVRAEMEEQRQKENVQAFAHLIENEAVKVFEALGFEASAQSTWRGAGSQPTFAIDLTLPMLRNSKGHPRYYVQYAGSENLEKPEPALVFFNRLQQVLGDFVGDLEHSTGIKVDRTMIDSPFNPQADYIEPSKEVKEAVNKANSKQRKKDDAFYSRKAKELKLRKQRAADAEKAKAKKRK